MIDRPTAYFVVKLLREAISRRMQDDPLLEQRYLMGDDSMVEDALLEACSSVGVRTVDYRMALEVDSTLVQLHHWSVTEAIVGTADPGPYDCIAPGRLWPA